MNEIEIRIGATDDTARGTQQAESRLRRTGKVAATALGAAGAVAGGMFAKGLADNMGIEVANDKLAGQLGLSTEEAKKAGEVAGDVYGQNWGDSIETVNEALRSVSTNLDSVGDTSKEELGQMTTDALALAQTFDMDVTKSTEAAGAMIKNGLAKNATEAFDIITAGAQNGVNKADDLLETFQEYSPQFAKLGIGGKDALNLLSAGLKAGARDTDVIADSFKELSIRAIDGSTLTAQGFKAIGADSKQMAVEFGKGGEAARAATQKTMEGLLAIKDPIKQNIAGTALFGTQWEDTVRKILPALAGADEEIQVVDGSTAKMAATIGDNAQGRIDTMKRGFEQWTQSMASSDGALGLVTTGALEFGGGAVTAASQVALMAMSMRGTAAAAKAMAAATWIANGALKAMRVAMTLATGPVGLIILGVAALAAGLIYAYKHSEKFRTIVNSVFKISARIVLGAVSAMIEAFAELMHVLGKMPGPAGAPFRAAERAARAAKSKVDQLNASIQRMPTHKTVTIRVGTYFFQKGKQPGDYGKGLGVIAPGQGHGGITGAASGGARGSWTMVGEYGRELVKLPFGSQVKPHGGTEALMSGGGRGGELTIRWVGGNAGGEFMSWLRKNIRIEGGNVQKVLGQTA